MSGCAFDPSPDFSWFETFDSLPGREVGALPRHVEASAGMRPEQRPDRQLASQIMGEHGFMLFTSSSQSADHFQRGDKQEVLRT